MLCRRLWPNITFRILSKLGKIRQELTVENVHAVNHGVRDTCLIRWDRINLNVEENVLLLSENVGRDQNVQNLRCKTTIIGFGLQHYTTHAYCT